LCLSQPAIRSKSKPRGFTKIKKTNSADAFMKQLGFRTLLAIIILAFILAVYGTRNHQTTARLGSSARRVLYYVDPMNPTHTSDKPGLAPCGMKMEPVYADASTSTVAEKRAASLPSGAVELSALQQQLIGVRVASVERVSGKQKLRTLGKVSLDETRVYRITLPVDGLIRNVGPIVSGSVVQKDDLLADFYNRDFLTAQQTYLYALNTLDRFNDQESEDQLKLTRTQVRAAEENLEFLGMGELQLQDIARTRQIARNIELRSPVAGLVLARNAFQGLRFERGTELFRVCELDHVWILADVFEQEAQLYQPGTIAQVTLRTSKRTFQAKVSSALPQFDPSTRTMKVRLDAENPGYLLRPDMFVDVELPLALPEALVLPIEAVLDSGLRKTVFVVQGDGVFEPRTVETGWRFGDQIQITGGLMPGEQIVISGNFLIDSESRMKIAAADRSQITAQDPVCNMEVNIQTAKTASYQSEYGGKTYWFCAAACKTQFDQNPAEFIASSDNHDVKQALASDSVAPRKAFPEGLPQSALQVFPKIPTSVDAGPSSSSVDSQAKGIAFRRHRQLRTPQPAAAKVEAINSSATITAGSMPARD
jgi:membrane fusion protein, copper/silver efflux system